MPPLPSMIFYQTRNQKLVNYFFNLKKKLISQSTYHSKLKEEFKVKPRGFLILMTINKLNDNNKDLFNLNNMKLYHLVSKS